LYWQKMKFVSGLLIINNLQKSTELMKKLILFSALNICNIALSMDTATQIGSAEHISQIAQKQSIDLKKATATALVGKKNPEQIDFILLTQEMQLSDRDRQDLSNAIAKDVAPAKL